MTANERWHKWYNKNKEKEATRLKEYAINNRDKYLANKRKCYQNNKNTWKKYAKNNKEKILNNRKKWYKNQMVNNIEFRVLKNLRSRLNIAVKHEIKSNTTKELLGCDVKCLKQHLESQFKKGMSWDNYGEWHIDHIKPCAKFDLTKEAEQKECFNYTNLQPLWALDNIIKGDKI